MLISEKDLLFLSEKVVTRYMIKGVIPQKDKDDFQMHIVEKFLLKQENIEKNYLGKAKITTYCISILNNMCCELIRKESKYWKTILTDIPDYTISKYNTIKDTVVQDEIKYLNRIFLLQNSERAKIKIAFSYYYQIKINKEDIDGYIKTNNSKKTCPLDEEALSKSQIFINLADFFYQVENKEVKADAVRMWLTKKRNFIINLLNSPFNRTSYDKESFQILYELYNEDQINITNK